MMENGRLPHWWVATVLTWLPSSEGESQLPFGGGEKKDDDYDDEEEEEIWKNHMMQVYEMEEHLWYNGYMLWVVGWIQGRLIGWCGRWRLNACSFSKLLWIMKKMGSPVIPTPNLPTIYHPPSYMMLMPFTTRVCL